MHEPVSKFWHPGMEVECIKDATRKVGDMDFPMFRKGEQYTIAGIHHYDDYGLFLSFVGLDPRHLGHVKGFRRITKRKTSIAIFTALLDPSEDEIFREFEAAEFDYEDVQVPR